MNTVEANFTGMLLGTLLEQLFLAHLDPLVHVRSLSSLCVRQLLNQFHSNHWHNWTNVSLTTLRTNYIRAKTGWLGIKIVLPQIVVSVSC